MTADELLTTCQKAGIMLEARDDRLHVEAPAGVITAALREELTRRKAALVALLTPVTAFVTLNRGPILPVQAVVLALDLERRGFRMALNACREVQVEPAATLTEADVVAIRRWRRHLTAIVAYDAAAIEGVQ